MLSLDFFRSYDGIFRRYTDVSLKKVLKSQKDFFRSYNGFWDFCYAFGGIFYSQNGQFGDLVLILFYSYGGNPRRISNMILQ